KVNQWTLLIGTISLVYSISAGAIRPLVLDEQQRHEIFLTAAQSLFAVVMLSDREISWWQGLLLFLPFALQLIVPAWRIEVAVVYLALTVFWGFHYRRYLAALLPGREWPGGG
ncbi:MAG: sodium:calcium antiporter, partial [Gemmatimonadota bacterium]